MRRVFDLLASPQGVVLLTAVLFALLVGAFNPSFLSVATIIDLLRNSLVNGIFALGVMMILDRKSTRLNSSHLTQSRMPSSA